MEINISSKQYEIDDDLREFTEEQVNKIVTEFEHPRLNSVKVLYTSERNFVIVSINVTGKHVNINAKTKADSPKAAMANGADKITTQLRRYLDKVQDASVKADPATKEKIWTTVDLSNQANEFEDEL